MATFHDSTVASSRGGLLATPLLSHLHDIPQSGQPTIDAADVLRQLIANAGVLEDAAPGGERFVLAVLPPGLLEALASFAVPTSQPLPLLEWRAAQ